MRPRAAHGRTWIACFLALFALSATVGTAAAPDPSSQQGPPLPAAGSERPRPVVFDGEELFSVRADLGPLTAERRARGIEERLLRMARDPFLDPRQLVTEETELGTMVLYRGDLLFTLTARDAETEGEPAEALAKARISVILEAVRAYRDRRSAQFIGWHIAYLALASIALILLLRGFRWLSRRLEAWERRKSRKYIERFGLQGEARYIPWLYAAFRWTVWLCLAYFYALVVFRIFPPTRDWAYALGSYVLIPLKTLVVGALSQVPNLLILLAILLGTKVILKAIRTLFLQAEAGHIALPGVHPYWAMPAYKIVRLALLALVVVVGYPYIPGSDSPAFKGLTLFAGALVTFGASSAVSNLLNGLILMGVNPYKVGDRVRLGETEGDVTKITFFTTQVRTIKNVEVTVPNAQVLLGAIQNFSAQASESGLLLHTTVTIGYDAPWREVHRNLVEAARRTEHILDDPAPFVLQTALNDFYVSYQLNATTREANLQAQIYSELHKNIQDTFNEAGMEIMSPHFAALRDGNAVAIPESHRGEGYRPPRFGLDLSGRGPEKGS